MLKNLLLTFYQHTENRKNDIQLWFTEGKKHVGAWVSSMTTHGSWWFWSHATCQCHSILYSWALWPISSDDVDDWHDMMIESWSNLIFSFQAFVQMRFSFNTETKHGGSKKKSWTSLKAVSAAWLWVVSVFSWFVLKLLCRLLKKRRSLFGAPPWPQQFLRERALPLIFIFRVSRPP